MPNSTRARSSAKSPRKTETTTELQPRRKPKFPLWLHPTGQWAKKIRGHIFYFGTDKEKALKEYVRVKDDREAGREPPPPGEQRTSVKTLVNSFLTHKKHQLRNGELSLRQFNNYRDVCKRMVKRFGRYRAAEDLRPTDLLKYRRKLGTGKSPHTIGNEVQRVRVILRFAFEAGLIDRPIRFGEFKRPAKSAFRRHRQATGSRLFAPEDLRRIIDAADEQVRAMILLGINCGFGNADCGALPVIAVDLGSGWIDYPRPKTGIERRCPLWPETIEALKNWLSVRNRKQDDHRHLVFVTKYGQPWYRDGSPANPISAEFRKLLNRIDAKAVEEAKKLAEENRTKFEEPPKIRRPGLSFYSLRHSFQTIADEVGDYIATRRIMGHADHSMSDHYRERFHDDRLRKVGEHVHGWLFADSLAKQADPEST